MSAAPILEARPHAEPVLREWIAAAGSLAAYAATHPAAVELHGRGTIHAVPAPSPAAGEWVVRHYRRGGVLAPMLGDRYLRAGTPRPFREHALAVALEASGIPTPRAVGAAVYPAGAYYRGDLVTERVQDADDLAAVLFGVPSLPDGPGPGTEPLRTTAHHSPAAAMGAAGRLVRRLHDSGLVHPDLNVKNLLVSGGDEPRAIILDLDRATLVDTVSSRQRHRMLERFWRSVAKWEGRTGRVVGPDARAAFADAYARAAGAL